MLLCVTRLTGANKGDQAADIQAALADLPPAERLMHDMQAAFEAAEVPMTEYTTFDARELSRILPPPLVARAARRLLEETRERWLRRYVDKTVVKALKGPRGWAVAVETNVPRRQAFGGRILLLDTAGPLLQHSKLHERGVRTGKTGS